VSPAFLLWCYFTVLKNLIALTTFQAHRVSQLVFPDLLAKIAMRTNDEFHYSPRRKNHPEYRVASIDLACPLEATDSYKPIIITIN
jgi:hypothetical protein